MQTNEYIHESLIQLSPYLQWNSHGYDVAKMFAKKFDIISPVWLQIVKQGDDYAVAGTHDIDAGWLNDVRRKGKVQQQHQLCTVKGKHKSLLP